MIVMSMVLYHLIIVQSPISVFTMKKGWESNALENFLLSIKYNICWLGVEHQIRSIKLSFLAVLEVYKIVFTEKLDFEGAESQSHLESALTQEQVRLSLEFQCSFSNLTLSSAFVTLKKTQHTPETNSRINVWSWTSCMLLTYSLSRFLVLWACSH